MSYAGLQLSCDLAALDRAVRAVVYLTVEWSMPERQARTVLAHAVPLLRVPDVELFVLEEDAAATAAWLAARGFPAFARGAGTVLWTEHGRIVSELPEATSVTALVGETVRLWGSGRPHTA